MIKVLNCGIVVSDGWLVVFYGISTFIGYLMPNLFFYVNNQFVVREFEL